MSLVLYQFVGMTDQSLDTQKYYTIQFQNTWFYQSSQRWVWDKAWAKAEPRAFDVLYSKARYLTICVFSLRFGRLTHIILLLSMETTFVFNAFSLQGRMQRFAWLNGQTYWLWSLWRIRVIFLTHGGSSFGIRYSHDEQSSDPLILVNKFSYLSSLYLFPLDFSKNIFRSSKQL